LKSNLQLRVEVQLQVPSDGGNNFTSRLGRS
jgi:hypothetical protein